MKRNQKFGIVIAVAAVLVTGFFAWQKMRTKAMRPGTGEQLADTRTQITDATESMYESSVLVNSVKKEEDFGTGYVIGKNTVATNRHVVMEVKDKPEEAVIKVGHKDAAGNVQFQEFQIEEIVMPQDESVDVAVLKLKPNQEGKSVSDYAKIAEFGNTEDVKKGTEVTAVGYPGDKEYATLWASTGTVDMCDSGFISFLAVTAPGNSGSPLFNKEGKVIGMCNAGGDDASFGFLTGSKIVSFFQEHAE